ncbi:hypothetical protein EJ419_01995 [Alloscardovia theropitheci]|uniref:Uncharacterized protein n=1 Tax=Alloscardovia theropitheci TaxID=2496842 RepID=A0A4R0QWF7_9BIFI|nr:hypothetical protein [Alloscardovia theropitheci]TCD54727.1 hypothetical protein EJ419_01995 [Alloscardovia theropitheci]
MATTKQTYSSSADGGEESTELLWQLNHLLSEVYIPVIQDILDSTVAEFKHKAGEYSKEAKANIHNDMQQMDSAIKGEWSHSIKDSVNQHAKQLDSIGKGA